MFLDIKWNEFPKIIFHIKNSTFFLLVGLSAVADQRKTRIMIVAVFSQTTWPEFAVKKNAFFMTLSHLGFGWKHANNHGAVLLSLRTHNARGHNNANTYYKDSSDSVGKKWPKHKRWMITENEPHLNFQWSLIKLNGGLLVKLWLGKFVETAVFILRSKLF